MAAQNMAAGPWGGAGGVGWTYLPNGEICHITITYGDHINTIQFTSRDELGNMILSDQFGSQDGVNKAEIDLDVAKFEKISAISGTYGVGNDPPCLTSLNFTTNGNKSYGPFGSGKGTAFSFKAAVGENIIGFYGRNGWLMDSIGVYLKAIIKPIKDLSVGPWGASAGNEWSYEPKGWISNISITHNGYIHSLIFTSQDADGNVERSEKYGAQVGTKSNEVVIDIKNGEKIKYIRGTVAMVAQHVSITSLTFFTTMNKTFGPFGTAIGTPFSMTVNNGGFSGFHGRAGSWINAIGVFIRPTE